MCEIYADKACDIDADIEQLARQQRAGLNVVLADAVDADFWQDMEITKSRLGMPAPQSMCVSS